jgi:hypothetical protein
VAGYVRNCHIAISGRINTYFPVLPLECGLDAEAGKRDEAREFLTPIYGWFTEGFDTADLQEASALLKALA